jgi:hypothetical protein
VCHLLPHSIDARQVFFAVERPVEHVATRSSEN